MDGHNKSIIENKANKLIDSSNAHQSTIVDFWNPQYCDEVMLQDARAGLKVTVIKAPDEWIEAYMNQKHIDEKIKKIEIKDILKQEFEKYEDGFIVTNTAVELTSDENIPSIESYQNLTKNKNRVISGNEKYETFLSDRKNIIYYAADIEDSFFMNYKGERTWNLFNKKSLVRNITCLDTGDKIPGIHKPHVYIGSKGSSFGIHLENGNLNSMNYQLRGAKKIWFVVTQKDTEKFENLLTTILKKKLGQFYPNCTNIIAHKKFIITENFLIKNNVEYTKVIQEPGMFVITHPHGFHGGYNLGYNVNEAVNFANQKTIIYFASYPTCSCKDCDLRMDNSKIIKHFYRRILDSNYIQGSPDSKNIVNKKKEKALKILDEGRSKIANKRVQESKLDDAIVRMWLNFLIHENPESINLTPSLRFFNKFVKYSSQRDLVLRGDLKIYNKMFRRILKQIYLRIINDGERFHLSDDDFILIRSKLNYKK